MSPLKLFSYMAAGKPILCSDLPVLKEIIQHGRNGLLIAPDDVEAWLTALKKMSSNSAERMQLGENARSDFLARHTWQQRGRRVLGLLADSGISGLDQRIMRVLCIIPTMGPGGAERTMSHLLAYLAKHHSVTLLTFESNDDVAFYPVPSTITYSRGDKLGGKGTARLARILSRPALISQTIERCAPDVVISFTDTTNVTVLFACSRRVPVIVSERIDPARHGIGWARRLLRTLAYPHARLIVVPSRRIGRYFSASLQDRIRVIGNPVPIPPI